MNSTVHGKLCSYIDGLYLSLEGMMIERRSLVWQGNIIGRASPKHSKLSAFGSNYGWKRWIPMGMEYNGYHFVRVTCLHFSMHFARSQATGDPKLSQHQTQTASCVIYVRMVIYLYISTPAKSSQQPRMICQSLSLLTQDAQRNQEPLTA